MWETEQQDAESVVGGGGNRLGQVRGWGLDSVSPVGVEGQEGVGRKTGEKRQDLTTAWVGGWRSRDGGSKGWCLGYWVEAFLASGERC